MKDIEQRLNKAFGMVAFTANRYLLDHMHRVQCDLGMDLNLAYVYGVFAHLCVANVQYPGADPAEVLQPDGFHIGSPKTVRLVDVAQVSGMPRETVRRKLEELAFQGRVERCADGKWGLLFSGVDDHTHEFTLETVRRLLKTAKELEEILQRVVVD